MASSKVVKTYSRKHPWTNVRSHAETTPTSYQLPPRSKSTLFRTFKQRRIEKTQRVLKSTISRRNPRLLTLSRIMNTFTSTKPRRRSAGPVKPPSTASRQGRDGFSPTEAQIRSRPSPIVSVKHHKSFRRTPARRSAPLFKPLELRSGPLPDVDFALLGVGYDRHGDLPGEHINEGYQDMVRVVGGVGDLDYTLGVQLGADLGPVTTDRVPETSPCLVTETPFLPDRFRPYLPGVSPLIRQCLGFI